MKLTLEEKIYKILEYCDYVKDWTCHNTYTVCYQVEIESTGGELETEQQCTECTQIDYTTDNIPFLYSAVRQAVLDARQYSQNYNCLSSVKVYIETYNSEGYLIDEDPIDEYEINFEKGNEVQ